MSVAQMGPLALIRHTRARIAPGICYGRTDVFADPGQPEEAEILRRLAALRPCVIWTSPASRCHGLALRARAATGADLAVDTRLLELDFGDWEGRRWDEISRADLDVWAADPIGFAAPGGETGAALIARASAAYNDIAASSAPQAVISHAGPLRVLIARATGTEIDLLRPGPALGSCEIVMRPPRRPAR